MNIGPYHLHGGLVPHQTQNQNGDPGRTRTLNLAIRSRLLYPVELRGHGGSVSGLGAALQ